MALPAGLNPGAGLVWNVSDFWCPDRVNALAFWYIFGQNLGDFGDFRNSIQTMIDHVSFEGSQVLLLPI